ncbi:hypothetical protein [Nocardioides sp.]|uniref:hypothetical protein n=1 Tax=Nocardioides sp. TaxID=35761 RepID=UPI0027352F7B|nr:hypothetical protein [Nocardioides sp.]MDP3890046.1 hypothetical protein [Nocardioides sp.]
MLAATYLCSDEWTYQQLDDAFAAAEVISTPPLDQESTLSDADLGRVSTWLSRLTC